NSRLVTEILKIGASLCASRVPLFKKIRICLVRQFRNASLTLPVRHALKNKTTNAIVAVRPHKQHNLTDYWAVDPLAFHQRQECVVNDALTVHEQKALSDETRCVWVSVLFRKSPQCAKAHARRNRLNRRFDLGKRKFLCQRAMVEGHGIEPRSTP